MTGLIVALHGYEDDPRPLAEAVTRAVHPNRWRIVAPTGPDDAPGGPSWLGSDGLATPERIRAATSAVHRAIDVSLAADGPADSIVVGGFSQGGAVALAVTFGAADAASGTPAPLIGGVFCLGGFLLPPDEVDYDFTQAQKRRALVVHGVDDETVPLQQGRAAARLLERRGAEVTFAEVPTGHVIDDVLLGPLGAWLDDAASGRSGTLGGGG